MLLALLRRLLDHFGFFRRPSPLVSLELERDMSSIQLTWVLPTPTSRQRDIAGVRIEGRVSEELPWTELNVVDAPETSLLLQDISPGDWTFRCIVLDVAGVPSPPIEASTSLDFDPPSPVSSFTAEVIED